MPQRDAIHEIVKQAIIKDGWNITKSDDPYVISYGERFLFVDLAAIKSNNIKQIQVALLAPKEG
jgi:hypothetical protein